MRADRGRDARKERREPIARKERPAVERKWQHDGFKQLAVEEKLMARLEAQASKPALSIKKISRAAAEGLMRPSLAAAKPPIMTGTKLLVSNFDPEITSEDLRELFGRLGEIKSLALHYQHNKPKGTAEVIFKLHKDALAAVEEYDGRIIDGRKVSVKIEGEAAAASRMQDDEDAPRARGGAHPDSGVKFMVTMNSPFPGAAATSGSSSTAAAPRQSAARFLDRVLPSDEKQAAAPRGRGSVRGGRGGRKGGAFNADKSSDDVDEAFNAYLAGR